MAADLLPWVERSYLSSFWKCKTSLLCTDCTFLSAEWWEPLYHLPFDVKDGAPGLELPDVGAQLGRAFLLGFVNELLWPEYLPLQGGAYSTHSTNSAQGTFNWRNSSYANFIQNYFLLKRMFDFFDNCDKCPKPGFLRGNIYVVANLQSQLMYTLAS